MLLCWKSRSRKRWLIDSVVLVMEIYVIYRILCHFDPSLSLTQSAPRPSLSTFALRDGQRVSLASNDPIDNGLFPRIANLDLETMEPLWSKEQHEIESKPSVAIVTMFKGTAGELSDITSANYRRYCARNGYTFIDATADPDLKATIDSEQHTLLLKFTIMRHYLDAYDWVMWSDADSIFLNHSRSLADAGVMDNDFDFVVPVGHAMDWHWGKIVNTGHFIAKSTPWTKTFLDTMWSLKPQSGAACPPDPFGPINGWLGVCGGSGNGLSYWLGDQGVFHSLTRSVLSPTTYLCHVKFLNMRDFNSEMPWYDDGDLIVHLPGRSNRQRLNVFSAFNQRADFSTGVVEDKSEPLGNDVHDWRVQRGLFEHYVGAGWNIPCRQIFSAQ